MRFTSHTLQEAKKVNNNEGVNASYGLAPEQELLKLSLTSFVDKSFYEKMNDKLVRIRNYCKQVDKDFLVKLSAWARSKGLRTINQIMIMESLSNKDFVYYFKKLVQRPDEIIDMLGYYVMVNGQSPKNIKIANKLKKAIKEKLEQFSEYQLAKYKGKGDVIRLVDIVNITHAHSEAIDKLMKGTLEVAHTRESELSKNGNTKESWERLLSENKLGALAFVRNMRNIISSGVKEEVICEYLKGVDFTKVFPFQLIQATDVIATETGLKFQSKLMSELQKKISESFIKYQGLFKGKVAIGVDDSGSMVTRINGKSNLMRDRMSMYYGLALAELGADLYVWNTRTKKIDLETFSLDKYRTDGGGTDVGCLLDTVKGKGYDTLFIITDEQSRISMSKSDIGNIIVWNLADYEHSLVPSYDKGYTYITGFNDAQFELVEDLRDIKGLINAIKSIEI